MLNVERELDRIKKAVAVGLGTEFEFGEHRASLVEIVGAGYEHTESGKRLLRLHRAGIVQAIEKKAGSDTLRQLELAAAVKQHITGVCKRASERACVRASMRACV